MKVPFRVGFALSCRPGFLIRKNYIGVHHQRFAGINNLSCKVAGDQ
jgi:hypothetical protein